MDTKNFLEEFQRGLAADFKKAINGLIADVKDGRRGVHLLEALAEGMSYGAGLPSGVKAAASAELRDSWQRSEQAKQVRRYSQDAMRSICLSGVDLLTFVDAITRKRGWGRIMGDSICDWYASRTVSQFKDLVSDELAGVEVGGWTHRNVLRKAKPCISDVRLAPYVALLVAAPKEQAA